MASKSSLCGTCYFRQLTKPSVVWCLECDEGFCVECTEHHASARATRSHGTVPMPEFQKLPSDVLKVSSFCSEHNEKYNMYCKKHDCPCCGRCMVESHNECNDIAMLNDVIKGIKSSNAFLDIEEILAEAAENIVKFCKDRKENLISLQEKRANIVKDIHQTRMNINSHLDKIQEKLIKEVHEAEEKESTAIRILLNQLEKKETDVKELQQTLSNLKLHASDLQTYLGMKQIDKDVAATDKAIKTLFKDNYSKQVILTCPIDPVLQNLSSSIQKFGNVGTESQESKITAISKKDKQAQVEVIENPSSYDSISLQLKQTVNIESSDIKGCSLLPNGKSVFCCYDVDSLVFINPDGTKDFEINCGAFDVAHMEKSNLVAVTAASYNSSVIRLIDIKDHKEVTSFKVYSENGGVTVRNDSLIFIAGFRGIGLFDVRNKKRVIIRRTGIDVFAFIATHNGKIYYTQEKNHSVTCLDLHGMEKWNFSDPEILKSPTGVAVDNNGNVFVAGQGTQNVVIISADGQNCKQLLSAKDGIDLPQGLHFNNSTQSLLIANKKKTALLYEIVKK